LRLDARAYPSPLGGLSSPWSRTTKDASSATHGAPEATHALDEHQIIAENKRENGMSREELNALIRCPIDWISETGEEEGVVSILQFDWYHCLNEYAVSSDEHVTDIDGFNDEELDPEELRRLIANLKLRKCERIHCHKERAGRLLDYGSNNHPSTENISLQVPINSIFRNAHAAQYRISIRITEAPTCKRRFGAGSSGAFPRWPRLKCMKRCLLQGPKRMSATTASFGIDSSIPNRPRSRCACALTVLGRWELLREKKRRTFVTTSTSVRGRLMHSL
jgi:hypothetical protein